MQPLDHGRPPRSVVLKQGSFRRGAPLARWLEALRLFIVPVALLCTVTAARAQRSVSLAWDASQDTNVTDYVVRYGFRSRVYSKSFHTGGGTTAAIGGLRDGLGYFITVTAINALGLESDPSEEIQYADPCAARLVNLTVTASKNPTNGAKVSFPAVADRKYQVESS